MEAARMLRMRGHEVTLYEKRDRLGGNFNYAFIPEEKREFREIVQYLSGQMAKLDVKVILNKEATPELIRAERPDAVLVATGAAPIIPDISGIGRENVVLATDVLDGKAGIGKKIVVIGGGLVGCEVALFLAKSGREVAIIEMLKKWGRDVNWTVRNLILKPMLEELGINIMAGWKCIGIDNGEVIVTENGEKKRIKADTVVLAVGFKANNNLYETLKDEIPEIYCFGDCREPGKLMNAIHEAAETALLI